MGKQRMHLSGRSVQRDWAERKRMMMRGCPVGPDEKDPRSRFALVQRRQLARATLLWVD